MKEVIVLIGNYGSGKTELALNFAFQAANQGKKVELLDLDMVNTYFRLTDRSGLIKSKEIRLVSLNFVHSSVETLSLPAEVASAFALDWDTVIFDVGGDPAGATALGRYREDFDALPLAGEGTKPRVGVVGEILVKFHPTANNQIVDVIEREGCEAVVPGLIEFFLFGIAGGIFQQPIGKSKKSALGSKIGLAAIKKLRKPVNDALEKSSRFHPPADIYELADYASEILSLCNSMGEGWLLTAEMVELIRSGCPNVVCTQPFACLPNHVVGKATIKELRRRYPESNIVAVDYDPGASEVNQLNRIKLMIAVAKANLAEKEAEARAARAVARDGAPEEPETVAASVEVETTEVVG